jgi:hypothetical protein
VRNDRKGGKVHTFLSCFAKLDEFNLHQRNTPTPKGSYFRKFAELPMAAKKDSQNQPDPQQENGPRLDLSGHFQWSLNGTSLKKWLLPIFTLLAGGSSLWGIGAMQQNQLPSVPSEPAIEQPVPDRIPSSSTTKRYTCDEIRDRREAQQLLAEGHTYLDRDGDGVACDSLQ